jgi:peroxiredoxin
MKKILLFFLIFLTSFHLKAQEILDTLMNGDFPIYSSFNMKREQIDTLRNNHTLDKPAFDFPMMRLDSTQFKLSDFKGKVILLNFFFYECGGCRLEVPFLNEIHQAIKGKNAILFSVSTMDSIHIAKKYKQELGVEYEIIPAHQFQPSLSRPGDFIPINIFVVRREYWTNTFPATYFIDKKGVIRYSEISYDISKKEEYKQRYLEWIEKLLAEPN